MWSASTSRRRARRSSRRHARRPQSRRRLRRKAMQRHVGIFMTVVVLALTLTGVGSVQASHDIVLGFQCDRTGATQTVGVVICPGYHDYINLVNAQGGVMGHRLRVDEVDHEYKVPPAIESYERFKKAGAVVIGVYGTPQIYAVPPPGVEMGAPVLDIAQRYRADFLIAHLFGRSPSVSIKELKRVGYPLRKVVSFVWGAAEADIEAAGGYALADGYYGLQFAGVGQDFPVINEIREMYKKQGKDAPKEMASTVYYNRGVLIAALHVEAIRNALKARPDGKITGEDVKKGFEQIKGFTLGGLVPPLEVT